uniref:Olfactory receptor n=1 Tax=Varanus komodoensis TaxID=61221 RepID=A0A8D2LT32_VARKO
MFPCLGTVGSGMSQMATANYTVMTNFILPGLTENQEIQVPLFLVFLVIYFITLVGNLGMIILIWMDSQLHCPMYYFLSGLSFLDACYSTTITPNMLVNLFVDHKAISYADCIAQYCFFAIFATTEFFLLAAMAYDRYMAICNPLLYISVMTRRLCTGLIVDSYLWGILNSLIHTSGLLRLSFCGPNIINHFFCDLTPLLKLACNDIYINEILLVLVTLSGIIALSTLLIIIISYLCILSSVIKIHSSQGRYKAFSTCASHLAVVTLFYGTVSLSHLLPSSMYSQDQEKISAVFYTLVVPMLNPFIYSFRNKEVKDALKRVFKSQCE